MFRKLFREIILVSLIEICLSSEMEVEKSLLNHMETISYNLYIRPSEKRIISNKNYYSPTEIKVRMVINEIGTLSEANNDFTVGVTLNQMWFDKRLIFNHSFEFLSLNALIKKGIWSPDLYFHNTKAVLGSSEMASQLWLYPNGTLVLSTTMRLTLYCQIELWRFPLDTQKCHMELGSYGYPTEYIKLQWWYNIYEVTKNVQLKDVYNTEFQYPTYKIEQNHSSLLLNGQFSILTVTFFFKRNFTYHIIYTFLPSTLIVCVSWVSFYIDYKAAPARIPFCLLTLLALMTQWSSLNASLPRLSYLKCIDIWMFICMTFVIFSLFEYAAINQLVIKRERKEKKKIKKPEPKKRRVSELRRCVSYDTPFSSCVFKKSVIFTGSSSKKLKEDCDNFYTEITQQKEERKPLLQPYHIDEISSFAFPFFFIMVNIIFWSMLIFYD